MKSEPAPEKRKHDFLIFWNCQRLVLNNVKEAELGTTKWTFRGWKTLIAIWNVAQLKRKTLNSKIYVRYQKNVIQSAKSAKTAKFSKSANQLHITAESAFNLSANIT